MRPARLFFAVTMIGLGVLGLIQRDFPPTWTGVPKRLPGREVLIYICALVSVVSGAGLLTQRWGILAARALLMYLLAWLVLFRISHVFVTPTVEATWWECGDTAVMAAAAWVLCGDKGLRHARVLYGLGLIPFGIAHFTYLQNTVADVPHWLGWPLGWAYFTGAAFIAAGLGVLTGVYARMAAVLSAVMISLFTLLVWVPIVVTGANAFQWTEFVNSWALAAAAWVVADSYRRMPWITIRRQENMSPTMA